MTPINRRHLFGLAAGAAVAPFLPRVEPEVVTRTTFTAYPLDFLPTDADREWAAEWLRGAVRIGSDFRVRLPSDYVSA